VNRRVLEIEKEIVQKTNEMNEFTLKYSIEVGKLLCEAKGLVKYGEWRNWINHNLPFCHDTANNLMRIYREYKDTDPESAIAKMNLSVANELTKLAFDLREETAKKIVEEGCSVRKAKIIISEKREHKREPNIMQIKRAIERKEQEREQLKNEIANLYRILADLTVQEG